jgi:hypothetical protein
VTVSVRYVYSETGASSKALLRDFWDSVLLLKDFPIDFWNVLLLAGIFYYSVYCESLRFGDSDTSSRSETYGFLWQCILILVCVLQTPSFFFDSVHIKPL